MTDDSQTINEWRETVRDLYDDLHFGQDNVFTGSRLAARLIHFIEQRHPGFFNEACPGKVGATDGRERPWRERMENHNARGATD